MAEVDLMRRYPKTSRDEALLTERAAVTEEDRAIAKQFGVDYFDGPRRLGLGGYRYNPRFFRPVVDDILDHYGLDRYNGILDVGCGKGFMMRDFADAVPFITVRGIDISEYCLDNALPDMRPYMSLASCDNLPFGNRSFDLVISIATIHNLDLEGVKRSLREIMRVTRRHAFIKVNGYRTDEECRDLHRWNLVANTILHVDHWLEVFAETGYTGDYAFFTP